MADYSPKQDPTIPCADAGMSFRKGDILEIVDQTDALWWQANKLPSNTACAGLIPSTNLLKRSELIMFIFSQYVFIYIYEFYRNYKSDCWLKEQFTQKMTLF